MRAQLLCTFAYLETLPASVSEIYKAYSVNGVTHMKCYYYVQAPVNVVCIYNVIATDSRYKDTISINRKKETNTHYSINALNGLIRTLNNGVLDKTFMIDWNHYKNMLLLADGEAQCKVIEIKEFNH